MNLHCLWLIVFSYVTLWILSKIVFAINYVWWTPRRLQLIMAKQGVRGPPARFLVGNVPEIKKMRDWALHQVGSFRHDMLSRILPDYVIWSKEYGKTHLVWWGPEPAVVITDLNVLKEIFAQKHALIFGKPYLSSQKLAQPFTGMGLIAVNGKVWAHQKRVIAPAFSSTMLKAFVEKMVRCTEEILQEFHQIVNDRNGKAEVDLPVYISRLSADVIARTQFGSSFKKGMGIFRKLELLKIFVFKYALYLILPGTSFLPSSAFRGMRKLRKEVEDCIHEIIRERKNSMTTKGEKTSYGTDLLGLLLAENQISSQERTTQQLVDECKTFLFVGHETTAKLVTWCVLLLAANPLWQERARTETLTVCNGNFPTADVISKLKTLEMIIHETLRLYPIVAGVTRLALADITIGNLFIPKGMSIYIPILAIHHDKELWGDDVHEFKPDRFAEGVGKACKHPMSYMPFVHGPRSCLGQNFSLIETKVILAMLLLRFRFNPSPNYKHAPVCGVTIEFTHGAPVILEAYQ